MPAPAAVYIIVAVVGAATAAFALKEFVYEPHLSGKIEELKNHARAYYLRKRAGRDRTQAQPFRSASDSDNDNGDDHAKENEADVELEGLFKSNGFFSDSNHNSDEMKLREGASAAAVTAIATGVLPSMSRNAGNDGFTLAHQDQQIRQRNVGPLVDLEETSLRDTIELYTPSEPTATVATPLNPFLDSNLLLLNDDDGPALEPTPQSHSLGQKTEREPLSSSNSNSFPPLSDAYILGVESPVVLAPLTPPRCQAGILVQGMPPPVPDSSSNNPWGSVTREALSPSVPDLGSLMSSWDAEHDSDRELDASLSVLSGNYPNERGLNEPVASPEMAWARDDTVSEGSFTTDSTTLTSSTSTSSIGSRAEEGPGDGELNPFLGYPHLESIEQSVSGLSDAEWERLSDIETRSHSP